MQLYLTLLDYVTILRNMSKSELNIRDEEQVERFSKIFKALPNPNRLKILLELTNCSVSEDDFPTSIDIDQVENCQQEFAKTFMDQAKETGAKTALYFLNNMDFKGCQGCNVSKTKKEVCVLKDDLIPVLEDLNASDIVVFFLCTDLKPRPFGKKL